MRASSWVSSTFALHVCSEIQVSLVCSLGHGMAWAHGVEDTKTSFEPNHPYYEGSDHSPVFCSVLVSQCSCDIAATLRLLPLHYVVFQPPWYLESIPQSARARAVAEEVGNTFDWFFIFQHAILLVFFPPMSSLESQWEFILLDA